MKLQYSSLRYWIIILVFITILYLYWSGLAFRQIVENAEENSILGQKGTNSDKKNDVDIVIVVVVCGDRFDESITMLKSAIMFTRTSKLRLIVIAEDQHIEAFREKLTEWQEIVNGRFQFQVRPLEFPTAMANEWRNLFKPCASQRLFLPNVLHDIDAILYMDADTLFLTGAEAVWSHFNRMNSSQLAALAPEHEDPNVAWYNRFARHPYYGKLGVNTGVMLMNLTRMRHFQWVDYVVPIYKRYKLKITWGDQDIVNIIFHFHPDKLLEYSCAYNFRPDHCMYGPACKAVYTSNPATPNGALVLHGSRAAFHQPQRLHSFHATYRAFQEYQLTPAGAQSTDDINTHFVQVLEQYLQEIDDAAAVKGSKCGEHNDVFLVSVRRWVEDNEMSDGDTLTA